MPLLALLLVFMVAACSAPPEPTRPEMLQGGDFRPLSEVPNRPRITVPMGQRLVFEDQLKKSNEAARRQQVEAGLAAEPQLPEGEPTLPQEIADE